MAEKEFQKKITALRTRVVGLENDLKLARTELSEVANAYRVYLQMKGQPTDEAKTADSVAIRPTKLVDIVRRILRDGPKDGMTRQEIFREMITHWRPDLELISLTSTLTYLRAGDLVANKNRQWKLTAKGRKSA